MPAIFETDDDFVSKFIDNKIHTQTRMTGRIKSTIKSLEKNIGIKRKVLSEDLQD